MPMTFELSDEDVARLRKTADALKIDLNQLVARALANGAYVVAEAEKGNKILIEDKHRSRFLLKVS